MVLNILKGVNCLKTFVMSKIWEAINSVEKRNFLSGKLRNKKTCARLMKMLVFPTAFFFTYCNNWLFAF
jgi:hypothetical protein